MANDYDPRNDYRGGREGRDRGMTRDNGQSSARDYAAARQDRDYDRGRELAGGGNFGRGYDEQYGQGGRDYYGGERQRGAGFAGSPAQGGREYHGSYAGDGRRFEDVGDRSDWDDDTRQRAGGSRGPQRASQGSDDDRGFLDRAGDEVRSWFGDADAERRRERDQRDTGLRPGAHPHDEHYHNWRRSQMEELDRDYHEYRQENAAKFANEFGSWRSERQTQRSSLGQVNEHMEVIGSDGGHVGTVDKVRGDRIILTKNDKDAGGHHHSIPSRWINQVDDKVHIRKTADEAKSHWRDEERSNAFFEQGQAASTSAITTEAGKAENDGGTAHNLNRSFSGTY